MELQKIGCGPIYRERNIDHDPNTYWFKHEYQKGKYEMIPIPPINGKIFNDTVIKHIFKFIIGQKDWETAKSIRLTSKAYKILFDLAKEEYAKNLKKIAKDWFFISEDKNTIDYNALNHQNNTFANPTVANPLSFRKAPEIKIPHIRDIGEDGENADFAKEALLLGKVDLFLQYSSKISPSKVWIDYWWLDLCNFMGEHKCSNETFSKALPLPAKENRKVFVCYLCTFLDAFKIDPIKDLAQVRGLVQCLDNGELIEYLTKLVKLKHLDKVMFFLSAWLQGYSREQILKEALPVLKKLPEEFLFHIAQKENDERTTDLQKNSVKLNLGMNLHQLVSELFPDLKKENTPIVPVVPSIQVSTITNPTPPSTNQKRYNLNRCSLAKEAFLLKQMEVFYVYLSQISAPPPGKVSPHWLNLSEFMGEMRCPANIFFRALEIFNPTLKNFDDDYLVAYLRGFKSPKCEELANNIADVELLTPIVTLLSQQSFIRFLTKLYNSENLEKAKCYLYIWMNDLPPDELDSAISFLKKLPEQLSQDYLYQKAT